MATRFFCLLLSTSAVAGLAIISSPVLAQDAPVIIQPDVERRTITDADIDSENIEVGVFVGQVGIEDFSSSAVYGVSLAYHVTENIFTELSYGQSKAGKTSYEILSGGAAFLTEDERKYRYYDLSVGYNFNGEVFLTEGTAYNSDFYVLLGAGSTDFAGDNHFTVSVGAGYRLLLTDYFALRLDVRDHIFNSELIGEKKDTHNLQYTLGATFFF